MSIQAPQGILNIPNAILRVGKLSVDEVVGADTILNTVARNTILLVDDEAYHENKNWSLKLPNAWAGEFECNTASAGNYSEFNFYNEGASSNAQGYNLTFNDTAVELRYDGTLLKTGTLASTITGTGVKKVRLMFERTILSVTVDGTLVFTHDDTGGPRPRVYSTTAGGFLNFFTNGGALKNLKIVNEKWISDGTSNIAYVGGGEVAIGQSLNLQQVSNTSTIKANSNVVTEFNRSKKLIKYPRVALTQNALNNGYTVSQSGTNSAENRKAWTLFNNDVTTDDQYHAVPQSELGEGNPYNPSTGAYEPDVGYEDGLGDVAGEYVYVVMPDKIKLQGVSVHPRDGFLARSAESARFMGSNDNGTTWVDLGGYTNYVWPAGSQEPGNFFTVDSNEYYNYIGVVWTKVKGGTGGDTVNMAEVQFFGTPEYDPEAHGTDVTVKSVANVPNTDWLEVYYEGKNYTNGNSVQDETDNNIDGSFTGITYNTEYNSFDFSGVADSSKITATLPSTFAGNQPFTVSVWFKRYNDLETENTIWRIGPRTDEKCLGLAVSNGNFNFFGNDSTDGIFSSTTFNGGGYVVGRWYHVACVYDGSSRYIFIDSVRDGTTVTNSLDFNASTELVLGFNGVNKYLNGSIANFRLFNRALSSDEIWQLYAYQKKYFGHGDLGMTLKAGRLGIGTSEPRAMLDVRGDARLYGINHCSAYKSDGGYVSKGNSYTWTALAFDTFLTEYGGFGFVNNGIRIPVSGVYHCYTHAVFTKYATSTFREWRVRVELWVNDTNESNGVDYSNMGKVFENMQLTSGMEGNRGFSQVVLTRTLVLNAGDILYSKVIGHTDSNTEIDERCNNLQVFMIQAI
jgi:hypothetical protein